MPGHRWRRAAAGWLRLAADSLLPAQESQGQASAEDRRYDGGRPGEGDSGGLQRAGIVGVGFPDAGSGVGRRFDVAGAPEHWVKLLRQAGLAPGAPRHAESPLADPEVDGASGYDAAAAPRVARDATINAGPAGPEAGTVGAGTVQGAHGPRLRAGTRHIPQLIIGSRAAAEQPGQERGNQRSSQQTASPPESTPKRLPATAAGSKPGSATVDSGPRPAPAEPPDAAAATAGLAAVGSSQPAPEGLRNPFRLRPAPAVPGTRQAQREPQSQEDQAPKATPNQAEVHGAAPPTAPSPGPATLRPAASAASELPTLHPPTGRPGAERPSSAGPEPPHPSTEGAAGHEGRSAVVGSPLHPPAGTESTPRPAVAGEWPELPHHQLPQTTALPPERVEHLLTRTLRLRDEQRAV